MSSKRLIAHEVRFFDPKPAAIHGLAYETKSRRLAVVRCSNDAQEGFDAGYFVELWNLRDAPCMEFKLDLPAEWRDSVEAVCWRSSTILYLAGIHGHVLVLSSESGKLLACTVKPRKLRTKISRNLDLVGAINVPAKFSSDQYDDPGTRFQVGTAAAVSGPIWCLSLNETKTVLAAGTEDGFISLFNVETEDSLQFLRALEPKGSRVMSLSWHPRSDSNLMVASGRGFIWLWDMNRFMLKSEMRPAKKGKEETIVSSVLLLKDGTIVSGDSTGATIFWDPLTGTPLATFGCHKSGILSLACINLRDGVRVYSAGIDSTICEMRLAPVENGAQNWIQTSPRHYHTHDVRALCAAGKKLASGGQDSYLIIFSGPPNKYFVKIPPNATNGSFVTARSCLNQKVPLLLLQNSSSLEIWQLSSPSDNTSPDYTLLLKFTFANGRELITASSISANGEWLVASGQNRCKGYRVILSNDHESHPDINLIPAQPAEETLHQSVSCFFFCRGGRLLVADATGVYVCEPRWENDQGQQTARIEKTIRICHVSPDERVRLLCSTGTGRYVAVLTSRNQVKVYDRKKAAPLPMETDDAEDIEMVPPSPWRSTEPPQSSSMVTCMTLSEHNPPQLLLCYANGVTAFFNVKTCQYSNVDGIELHDPLLPFLNCSVEGNLAVLHNWRKGCLLEWEDGRWNVRKMLSYDEYLIRSILTQTGELINVVQTPSMLQNQLPPALARKVFGI